MLLRCAISANVTIIQRTPAARQMYPTIERSIPEMLSRTANAKIAPTTIRVMLPPIPMRPSILR